MTKSKKQLFPAWCVEVFTEEVMFHVESDVVMEAVPVGSEVAREESGRGEWPRRCGDQKAQQVLRVKGCYTKLRQKHSKSCLLS